MGGERILRHHAARDLMYSWAALAGLQPEEQPGLLHSSGRKKASDHVGALTFFMYGFRACSALRQHAVFVEWRLEPVRSAGAGGATVVKLLSFVGSCECGLIPGHCPVLLDPTSGSDMVGVRTVRNASVFCRRWS